MLPSLTRRPARCSAAEMKGAEMKVGQAERVAGASLHSGGEKVVSNMPTLHFRLLITPPPPPLLTSSLALKLRRERRKRFDVSGEGHVVIAH